MMSAPTQDAFLTKIAKAVIDDIWDDPRRLFIPVYRHDIKTEGQANSTPNLPMLYIWNEGAAGEWSAYVFVINEYGRCRWIPGKAATEIGPEICPRPRHDLANDSHVAKQGRSGSVRQSQMHAQPSLYHAG